MTQHKPSSMTEKEMRVWLLSNIRVDENGCWLWQLGRSGGYGKVVYDGKNQAAHIVCYTLFVGPVPDGKQLNHSCNIKLCCNPTHVYPGTQADNGADMRAAFRQRRILMAKGVSVSDEVKEEVIAMRTRGQLMPTDIARELSLSSQTVYNILSEAGLSGANVTNVRVSRATPLSDDEIGKLITRYVNDENVSELCDEFRISIPYMYDILRDHGVSTRQAAQQEQRQQKIDDAVTMYRNNEPLHRIHQATGISNFTLNRELHKRGIPLRRPRLRDRS